MTHVFYVESISERGIEPLREIFDKLGGWPLAKNVEKVSIKWFDLILGAIKENLVINFPTQLSSITNPSSDFHREILMMSPMKLSLSDLNHYKNASIGMRSEFFQKYEQHLIHLAVLFGAEYDNAVEEVSKVIEFEIALANVSLNFQQFLL